MLADKIQQRQSGIVLYGMVPPKRGTDSVKLQEIAERQVERIAALDIDGLIVYDLQDEASRTAEARPFPFMETVNGADYSRDYLKALDLPRIIYRSVGKYRESELTQFLQEADQHNDLTVFVGAASREQAVNLTMAQAYELKQKLQSSVPLGGVTIPERHSNKGDEHKRVFQKMARGCSFFVSQGVYDVNAAKNFLSDYYYYGQEQGIPLVPIIFTLTPCGSEKTLKFMKWLGISIPRWLENDLLHSQDILEQSVTYSARHYLELLEFAESKGIPVGCNIESVAVRKVEVEASVELLERIRAATSS